MAIAGDLLALAPQGEGNLAVLSLSCGMDPLHPQDKEVRETPEGYAGSRSAAGSRR
jgi:hypothetical protein